MRLLVIAIASFAAAGAAAAAQPGVASPQRAKMNWMLHCQGCHLPNAMGTQKGAPALAHEVARFLAVKGGREYLTRVPGVANAALSDDQLAELLNWTLETFDPEHMPTDFAPFSASEIAAGRQAPFVSEASVIRTKLQQEIHKNEKASARGAK